MSEEKKKTKCFMDSGFFPSDLRQRASYTDLGFGGFPLTSSVSNGFHSPNDRTTPISNPFPNNQSHTSTLVAENDLDVSQKLRNMCISDEERSIFTPGFNHSVFYGSRNLNGCSRIDQAREGFSHRETSNPKRGYGDFRRSEQGLRARCEGLVQSSHGESNHSLAEYPFLDYHRPEFLGSQEAHNSNPSFHRPNGLTKNMSLRNRDYTFEHLNLQNPRSFSIIPQKSRLALQENDAFDPLMYSGNSIFPPISAMDLPLNLASMVTIYGSVYLMAKEKMGCRFLQYLIEEGRNMDVMIVFREVINHVIEVAMDQFGNYLMQKLLQVCNDEQRTEILIRFISEPGLLVNISINAYG